MGIIKCRVPLNVQFEVTYNCNNRCVFCYNSETANTYRELKTQEAILIIKDLASCGVLSVNFNGGEPLTREDYFDIVQAADQCGLDIHMNTNANLVDGLNARMIAKYFPAVCTTILSSNSKTHDMLSGRIGALSDAERGIKLLQKQSVYVAVNIMLSQLNIEDIEQTCGCLRALNIRSVLLTRYVPCEMNAVGLEISDQQFLDTVAKLYKYNEKYSCFDRIAFPQPYKLCQVSGALHEKIAESNIACNIGLCTASISPNGDLTPCNLVKNPILGNLKDVEFQVLWDRFEGDIFFCHEHLDNRCIDCKDLESCGGGCKGYNDALKKGRTSK